MSPINGGQTSCDRNKYLDIIQAQEGGKRRWGNQGGRRFLATEEHCIQFAFRQGSLSSHSAALRTNCFPVTLTQITAVFVYINKMVVQVKDFQHTVDCRCEGNLRGMLNGNCNTHTTPAPPFFLWSCAWHASQPHDSSTNDSISSSRRIAMVHTMTRKPTWATGITDSRQAQWLEPWHVP